LTELTARRPTPDDLDAVVELGNAFERVLLLNAFSHFHARGTRRVGPGVDAESPTGATRLYERAGMHVGEETAIYRKDFE
jgi:ribosomal protein S18 acetylase RimI-like enzyme